MAVVSEAQQNYVEQWFVIAKFSGPVEALQFLRVGFRGLSGCVPEDGHRVNIVLRHPDAAQNGLIEHCEVALRVVRCNDPLVAPEPVYPCPGNSVTEFGAG